MSPSHNPPRPLRLITPLLLLCASVVNLLNAADTTSAADEAITLDEFSVSSKSLKNEYIASESVTASRAAQKILDTPFSVQVVTEGLLNDFQLFDADEPMKLVAGAGATGGFAARIRGFSRRYLYDGVNSAVTSPVAPVMTRQTEILKGPQSANYGDSAPGGVVNRISKRPSATQEYSLSTTASTEEYYRLAGTASGPLGKKFYYIAWFDDFIRPVTSYPTVSQSRDIQQYYGLTLQWNPSRNTSFSLTPSYHKQEIQGYQYGAGYMHYHLNTTDTDANGDYVRYTNYWDGVGDTFTASKDSRNFTEHIGLSALFEHRFSRKTSLRIFLNYLDYTVDYHTWAGGTHYYAYDANYPDDPPHLSYRYPYKYHTDRQSVVSKGDFIHRFNTSTLLPLRHKLLLGYDAVWRTEDHYEYRIPTRLLDAIYGGATYGAYNGDPYTPLFHYIDLPYSAYSDSFIQSVNYAPTDRDELDFGFFSTLLSEAFQNRLQTFLSLRWQRYDVETGCYWAYYADPDAPNPVVVNYKGKITGSKLTYSAGASWHFFGDNLVGYASLSTGYDITSIYFDRGIARVTPPPQSEGWEIGFKGENLFNYLTYTLCYFSTFEYNAMANDDFVNIDSIGGGNPEYIWGALTKSHGIELTLSAKPTPNLTLILATGWTASKILNTANVHAVGLSSAGAPKFTVALTAKYTPPFIRGLSIGIMPWWQDTCIISYPTPTYTGRILPPIFLTDAYVSYYWRRGKNRNYIAFNIRNAFNKKWYNNSGRPQPGIEARLSYTYNFR